MKEVLLKLRSYLLSGVSYAIPFIACGGILIAIACAFSMTPHGPDITTASPFVKLINTVGSAAFSLMLPVLGGYIAYAMANKPGLVPGFIGGYLAGHLGFTSDGKEVSAGFLGAIAAGLLAGYVVNLIKKAPMPTFLRPIVPILILPIISSTVVSVLMLKVIGIPIADLMRFLGVWLETMGKGNAVVLAMILGGMIAVDMGGPINKAAFFFASAMIKEGNIAIMGAVGAAICTPPLGLGLATLIKRTLWTEEEREAGKAALAMGCIGITEGAIPFAAGDPVRVIPSIMLGSATAATIAMLGGAGNNAPHGGLIVLPVIDHRLAYCCAILVGVVVTALAVNFAKSKKKTESSS